MAERVMGMVSTGMSAATLVLFQMASVLASVGTSAMMLVLCLVTPALVG